jgi:uncharacterized hydrophobic protein (TIGR00271 family)
MADSEKSLASKATHLQRWLRISPEQKPKVYAQIYSMADISSLNYWLEIVFSAGIAALGLVLNSPAVIIGAMLISPLMGPIMAMGLALAAGDLYLAVKAIMNLIASIALAIAFSAMIVWLLPFHAVTGEIMARTNPTLLDLGVALLSGLAGSVAMSRFGGRDEVTTLPGVAVAVALMPPLCTVGFGLGSGAITRIMGGAGLLFLTNLVAIVASAFVVFLVIGMNAPEIRAEMEKSRKGGLLTPALSRGPLARVLRNGGQLGWRILVMVILLGAIAGPLRSAFMQVAGEAVARGAIQDVVKRLLPPGALVSQQVEVGRDNVAIRLISTHDVPQDKIEAAEREIERRSGRKAVLTLSSIASQSELAELMQRFSAPQQPALSAPAASLAQIHRGLIDRIQPILGDVWPTETPLQDFDIVFGSAGAVLQVRYTSAHVLDRVSQTVLERELREKLNAPGLSLDAIRVAPARKTAKNKTKQ